MRAARSTRVDLEGWAVGLLGDKRRESLAVEGTLPKVKQSGSSSRSESQRPNGDRYGR